MIKISSINYFGLNRPEATLTDQRNPKRRDLYRVERKNLPAKRNFHHLHQRQSFQRPNLRKVSKTFQKLCRKRRKRWWTPFHQVNSWNPLQTQKISTKQLLLVSNVIQPIDLGYQSGQSWRLISSRLMANNLKLPCQNLSQSLVAHLKQEHFWIHKSQW